MDFSDALHHCKDGFKITRDGWNKPGQFVVFQMGYPNGIPINENTAEATGIAQGTVCNFAPYLMLHGGQGTFMPWQPDQDDLMANDWELVTSF